MRPIRWDDGTRFDDPNARWGDPAMMLEPGDPGYVLPPPPVSPVTSPLTRKTMSSNATPANRIVLSALARTIYAGQLTHAASVGLLHHLPPRMDGTLKKLDGDPAAAPLSAANKGSQLVYRDCVDATGDAEAALRVLSDTTAKAWLEGYRKIMEGVHGKKASAGWTAAGFPQGSTAVPRNHDARLLLLNDARAYLVAHPTYEATLPQPSGPALAITAAEALARQTQMQAAKTLVATRSAEQAACKNFRDADVDGLFAEVSGTISELDDLLSDTDPRWEVFGLNIPANPNPPLGVASLAITAAGSGRELLAWPYAVRAVYYRVFLKQVGVDADFVNVADPQDLEYTLKNLTPGASIQAYVVPMNAAGAGAASPTVTKVVGA